MNGIRKKVFSWVTGTHVAVLLLLLLIPLIKSLFHPKPKEMITFFDLAGAPPPPAIEPDPAPEPEPKPAPKPKPIPKPAVTNPPPKKVETKKPDIKKPAATNAPPKKAITNAPPKPKTEAEKLAAIRQNTKVRNPNAPSAPARKQPDFSGLRDALNSAATGPRTGSGSGAGSGSGGGMYSPFAGYYDSIKQRMYAVWQQPAGVPIGLTATASIRVERDGTVSLKSISRRSGNVPFDQSVQDALNATVRLPAPPADLPSNTISIEFFLSD